MRCSVAGLLSPDVFKKHACPPLTPVLAERKFVVYFSSPCSAWHMSRLSCHHSHHYLPLHSGMPIRSFLTLSLGLFKVFDTKKDGDLDLKELLRGLGLICKRDDDALFGGSFAVLLRALTVLLRASKLLPMTTSQTLAQP